MADIPRDERKVTDADFFEAMDLSRRGLAHVRRAVEAADLAAARQATVDYFRTRQRPRWFFDRRDEIDRVGKRAGAGSGSEAIQVANEVLKHRFRLNKGAVVYDFGKNLNWRTKEMLGQWAAPSILKRCPFMQPLAAAYKQTGRKVYAAKFAELTERWLDDWPLVVDEDFGPTDAVFSKSEGRKAMPTADRVCRWLDMIYEGMAFAPEVPMDTAFRLIKSIWFTALQYRRYEKSPYRPANHHLWERGTAPFFFGTILPEFPEVARLADQGIPVIRKHVERSFLSDGGYEERSSNYAIGSVRFFLRPLRFAVENRIALFDRKQKDILRRCLENMARMTMPDGTPPDVGDGRARASSNANFLGGGGSLVGSPVVGDVLNRLRLQRFVSPEDRVALRGVERQDLPLTVHYPASGYFVARNGWAPRSSAMFLSVPGPGLKNHSHDDALSLQLVVRGEQVVGTPMTETYQLPYQEKHPTRGHFYAMTSHNVVLVNGEPARSIEELSPKWGPEPTPVKTVWKEVGGGIHVLGSHKGYLGVKLSREVEFRYRKGWTVQDRVQGGEGKPHVARWHFEYGVEVVEAGDGFVAKAGDVRLGICITGEGKVQTRLYRDTRWLGKNPTRAGQPVPWVLDATFGGSGDDGLETRFEILRNST